MKIKLSLKFKKQCEKYDVNFIDINRDRKEIMLEILNQIKAEIKN